MKEDVDFFLKNGADEVLTKPINMAVLREHWNRRITKSTTPFRDNSNP
jgi:DNA-binding response OmpR family regulator